MDFLAVGLGGFVGAVCRYLIGTMPIRETMIFPIKTFGINILGCVAIAVITVMAAKHTDLNPNMLLFLKVGLCGGFTTFSTFALETSDLIKSGNTMMAFLYVAGSVIVGVGAIFCMVWILVKN